MKTTNYLNLKKPEGTDFYDVEDNNSNMDVLDVKAKAIDDKIKSIEDLKNDKPVIITGTLESGKTSLTLQSEKLNDLSVIDVYTSVYGVNPVSIEPTLGSITLTFDEQRVDLGVRLEVKK